MTNRHVLALALLASFAARANADSIDSAVPTVVATVDAQIRAAWAEHGITPAPAADDARWLRRATIDLTGQLPEPEHIVEFLADKRADKRTREIDRLLASPAYAEHWGTYWDNLLIGRLTREAFIDRTAFQQWLREEFDKNAPWDQMVRDLITAEGYNSNRERPAGYSETPKDFDERFNPAVNWFMRHSRSIPDMAAATSKLFLGVQIQCAQCHDHKTEKWTQKDFKQFTACFAKTFPTYVDRPGMLLKVVGTYRMELKDRWFTPPYEKYETLFGSYKDYVNETPKMLNGPAAPSFGSRRVALANWVTAKDNPWFAKAIVNRLWGKLLGCGFVEPVDDFRPGNPPLLPATLDALADDFADHAYDLQHLLRVICSTGAYGRACVDLQRSAKEETYWGSFPLKALDVEELFDAICTATDTDDRLDRLSKGHFDMVRNAFITQLVSQMGTDDMAEVIEQEGTIPRSLLLLNGTLVCGSARLVPNEGLGTVLSRASDDVAAIEQLYLRTVSRRPTEVELKKWRAFLAKSREVAHTAGPPASTPTGLSALGVSPEIAHASEGADFTELLKHAKTGADFTALRKLVKNNADGALFVKAFQAFAAEAPFQHLAATGGGNTTREQAFEDIYWALLNCTEFLTNH
ncbi:MAG TPA: DUF1549 domain-containing protein [Pirellulales bacterium]|jgi:hypothetical protein|nr:DUF1549 domain-containing protein [Pirellulales bacterium]